MPGTERLFRWCLKQGEKGERHTGLRETSPDKEEASRHVNKAHHNLKAFDHNRELFPDWAVSTAFYAMYHALLAVLFRLGYESRNQECTVNAVEHLIDTNIIQLDRKYVWLLRRTSSMMPADARSLREQFQYGTEVSVNSAVLAELKRDATGCVEAVQICLEKL